MKTALPPLLLLLVLIGLSAMPVSAPAALGGMQAGELHCPVIAQIGQHRFALVPDEPLNYIHIDRIDVPDGFGGILLNYWWLHSESTSGESYSYVFDNINALARIRELKAP